MKDSRAISLWPAGGARQRPTVRALVLPAMMLAMVACFAVMAPDFLSFRNMQNIMVQASYIAVFACAQMIVLVVRGLDLSLGHTVSTVSVLYALVAVGGGFAEVLGPSQTLAVAAALTVAVLAGLFNGLCVAYLNVNAFVVTLASMNVLMGVASMLSDGHPVGGLPDTFSMIFYSGSLLGIPAPLAWGAGVLLVLHFGLTNMRVGRSLYIIGSNPRAAVLAGLAEKRLIMFAYVACSVIGAIGALMLTARTGSGEPNLGGNITLQSIAAAAIGGVSLRGGAGGVLAALLGALFITILSNGMNFMQINGYIQQIALGLVIVAAVSFDRRD
jgi:ribose transport system permease protein